MSVCHRSSLSPLISPLIRPIAKQIAITIVAVLPAISAGLQKEWQLSARIQAHAALTRDCSTILEDLKFLLTLPPDDFQTKIGTWHTAYTEAISRPLISV
jgi:hypothetical protein